MGIVKTLATLVIRIKGDNADANVKMEESKAKAEGLGDGFKKAGDAASKMQEIVGKITIPVAIVTALASIIRLFTDAIEKAKEFKRSVDEIGQSAAEKLSSSLLSRRLTEDQEKTRDVLKRYEEDFKRINAEIEELAKNESHLGASIRAAMQMFVDEPVMHTRRVEALEREFNQVSDLYRRASRDAREQEKEAEEKARRDREAAMRESFRVWREDLKRESDERNALHAQLADLEEDAARREQLRHDVAMRNREAEMSLLDPDNPHHEELLRLHREVIRKENERHEQRLEEIHKEANREIKQALQDHAESIIDASQSFGPELGTTSAQLEELLSLGRQIAGNTSGSGI